MVCSERIAKKLYQKERNKRIKIDIVRIRYKIQNQMPIIINKKILHSMISVKKDILLK